MQLEPLKHDQANNRYLYLNVQPHDSRYGQRKPTPPAAYFRPTLAGKKTWAEIVKDPSIPIVITEGEKKAAAACKAGIPPIGICGVWSFKSLKYGRKILDELDSHKIAWSR